jgi:hypothetical protein
VITKKSAVELQLSGRTSRITGKVRLFSPSGTEGLFFGYFLAWMMLSMFSLLFTKENKNVFSLSLSGRLSRTPVLRLILRHSKYMIQGRVRGFYKNHLNPPLQKEEEKNKSLPLLKGDCEGFFTVNTSAVTLTLSLQSVLDCFTLTGKANGQAKGSQRQ